MSIFGCCTVPWSFGAFQLYFRCFQEGHSTGDGDAKSSSLWWFETGLLGGSQLLWGVESQSQRFGWKKTTVKTRSDPGFLTNQSMNRWEKWFLTIRKHCFFLGGGGILGKLVSELLFFMFHQKVVKMGHYHKLQSSYQIRTVGSVDRWVSGAWSWWKFGAARGFSPRNHPRAKLRKKSRSKNNAQNHPKQTKHWNFNGSLFKVIFLARDIPTNSDSVSTCDSACLFTFMV